MKYFALLTLLMAVPATANVVGSDAQNFNPTPSAIDFVTVHSSETLVPGLLNFGLFLNYAKNPLPVHQVGSAQKTDSSLTGGDFNFGIGLMNGWDAGISLPFILNQQVSNTENTGSYSATGNTEVRLNSKVRLVGDSNAGVALIGSTNINRIKNNPYLGDGGGPIYNFEIAFDGTLGNVALALNLGHRWRNAGKPIAGSGIDPLTDQWLASTAISYHMPAYNTKVIAEILAAIPKEKPSETTSDRKHSVMEGLLGLKYDSNSNLAFHFGGGAGLEKGIASPDYRIYAGMSFSFGRAAAAVPSAQKDPYSSSRRERTPRAKKKKKSDTLMAVNDIEPAVSDETIRNVKVFNRGSFKHIVLNNLEFKDDTLLLTKESEIYMMEGLVPAIRELNQRRPVNRIVVEGYTDSINSSAVNKKVSQGRAEVVATMLRQNLGLNVLFTTLGLGEANPIGDNGNYQGRAMNNRVEIKLIYGRTSK